MATVTLDPAPTRDEPARPSWVRWFNQLYAAVQTILSGATLTNTTLAGTADLSGASVFLPAVNLAMGSNWGATYAPTFTGTGSMTVALANRFETVYYRIGA